MFNYSENQIGGFDITRDGKPFCFFDPDDETIIFKVSNVSLLQIEELSTYLTTTAFPD